MSVSPTPPRIEDLIDLARYPVADSTSGEGAAFTDACRVQFRDTGLCALPDFIRSAARRTLADEATAALDSAWFYDAQHDVYLDEGRTGRRPERTFVGSIPYDRIASGAALRRLYEWDPLTAFIGAVLGKSTFHRFADPLGACSVNVFVDGGAHGWHYDESEFAVTLMVQAPEQGGAFEYVPRSREAPDEDAIVAAVQAGDRSRVVELPFTPGTLLLFGGRQTLHRVTRVSGPRPRLVPVLCYAERPGQQNSEAVREMFWGRTVTSAP